MDFDGAIKAHAEWKVKLRNYIKKPDKSLDPAVVCLDNKCALGQWIYGEGAQFNSLAEYGSLKSEHARFHKCAANIVRLADAGKLQEAEADLSPTSEFNKLSTSVVGAIMTMRSKASK